MNPPAADELEITVIGGGVGEAIACHFGDGRWVLIDSFCRDERPVALTYLASIGVAPEAVEHIVCTHFHDDHSGGLDKLIEECAPERVWMSAALSQKESLGFLAKERRLPGDSPGARNVAAAMKHLPIGHVEWGIDGKPVIDEHDIVIKCLSPSSMSVTEAIQAFDVVPDDWFAGGRIYNHNANRASVALWVQFGAHGALLGADLENGHTGTGWRGVLSSTTWRALQREYERATLLKAAHHGSPNGRRPAKDALMLQTSAMAGVTRYNGGRNPRPHTDDRSWLRARVGGGYVIGSPPRSEPYKDPLARHLAPEGRRLLDGPVGWMQARIGLGSAPGDWSVEVGGATDPL